MQQLEHTFDTLLSLTQSLGQYLQQNQVTCWCHGYQTAAQGIHEAITDFWYRDGMDGRETIAYYGLVASDEKMLNQVTEINQLKADFADYIKKIREDSPNDLNRYKYELISRHSNLANELAAKGLARLNLKQVTRTIPVLRQNPAKISFNWYKSGKSIQRISKQEALKKLMRFDVLAPHIKVQYDRLGSLPDTEVLALVQNLSPIMRANILYGNGERTAFNVALPIFFPREQGMPAFSIPDSLPPEKRQRKIRNDNQLEEDPIAPSIRVYRYRPGR
ncbi:DNA replication terminus site-binding protein [Gynuella sunshinyii]|uniref:DNA replication terminus site-binding protein n=1 Tax=Gynuella sunshinyii YC6258 TaxID=1445510 RepID=A0A0C5VLZ1_9GAMM|nr:DNA replication terminus site-binding protein [Gynuella sunshinyii]AJQ95311.1 hypothetical Protein YC6258_03275 [Gynuella sunshinyii YC6258]